MEDPNVLYAQMFGNFQLHYNGSPLTGERLRDTYFTSLMQILLHHIDRGVSRDDLEEVLLGDRDVENRRQALQTIVYKAKKKLKNMGLPEENYIVLKKGVYYWTPKIPVREDAAVFDRLCRQAADCMEEEEQLTLYLDACYLYKGEFLSTYAAVLWAGAEARRYRKQFCECVERAASILRSREDWLRLEELGRYVTEVAPFSDWECLTMEALVGMENDEEAVRFYDDTVELYLQEQGLRPSDRLLELLNKLGTRIEHQYEVLDLIQMQLTEEEGEEPGGRE